MKQRVITGAVLTVVLVAAFALSNTVVFPLLCALLSAVGIYELAGLFGIRRNYALMLPAYVFSFALPLLSHLLDSRAFLLLPEQGAIRPSAYLTVLITSVVLFAFVTFVYSILTGGRVRFSVVLSFLLMTVYVTLGFSSLALLRRMGGLYLAIFAFIGSWISDTFAYFTGRAIGRHKLCPAVSPKKTVEGSVGGVVFSALVAALFGFILSHFELIGEANILWLALAGAILSLASQVGDLTASLLKREYDLKDYGALFPGHGGVLDRFDSVIAVAPLLLLFATLLGTDVSLLGANILWF